MFVKTRRKKGLLFHLRILGKCLVRLEKLYVENDSAGGCWSSGRISSAREGKGQFQVALMVNSMLGCKLRCGTGVVETESGKVGWNWIMKGLVCLLRNLNFILYVARNHQKLCNKEITRSFYFLFLYYLVRSFLEDNSCLWGLLKLVS